MTGKFKKIKYPDISEEKVESLKPAFVNLKLHIRENIFIL
jgi:hypothetical protein